MKKTKFLITIGILLIILLAACAAPPTEEMERAQDAVARAENNANAVRYASNTLVRARDALGRMQIEADARRYDAARNHAAEAIALAERAIDEGSIAAIRARDEANALINSLATPLSETTNALNAGREINLDLDYTRLFAELDSARRMYDEANRLLQANNPENAVAMGHNVRSSLSGINTALNDAVLAASRK